LSTSENRLTRRELLISGAVAGYALAAYPVSARAITTDSEGLVVGDAKVPVGGIEIDAYFARPEEIPNPPVVVVVHEIFGVHEYIRDVCRRLAKEGYFAVAPNLYHRQGDVTKLASVDEIIQTVVMKVPDAEVMADLDATLAWVERGGVGDVKRTAITGFCWGGRVVWLYSAHRPGLRAGAAWYGRLEGGVREQTPRHPIDLAAELHAPVIGLYGSEDSGIPLESIARMRAQLVEAEQKSEIVLFPAAPHGFHADYRDSYRVMAAGEAWRRMLDWFERHGLG
jgi:carboxymethylenebutenolidase